MPKRGRGSRRITLLSFQRPRPVRATHEKGLPRGGPQKSIPPYQLRFEGLLQLSRGWTLTCAAVFGSRRMIATIARASRSPKPDELPLPRLQESAVEIRARDVQIGDDPIVHANGALADQPARFTCRRRSEDVDEERRQMDRLPIGKNGVRDLVGSLTLPNHSREVSFRLARRLLPV